MAIEGFPEVFLTFGEFWIAWIFLFLEPAPIIALGFFVVPPGGRPLLFGGAARGSSISTGLGSSPIGFCISSVVLQAGWSCPCAWRARVSIAAAVSAIRLLTSPSNTLCLLAALSTGSETLTYCMVVTCSSFRISSCSCLCFSISAMVSISPGDVWGVLMCSVYSVGFFSFQMRLLVSPLAPNERDLLLVSVLGGGGRACWAGAFPGSCCVALVRGLSLLYVWESTGDSDLLCVVSLRIGRLGDKFWRFCLGSSLECFADGLVPKGLPCLSRRWLK